MITLSGSGGTERIREVGGISGPLYVGGADPSVSVLSPTTSIGSAYMSVSSPLLGASSSKDHSLSQAQAPLPVPPLPSTLKSSTNSTSTTATQTLKMDTMKPMPTTPTSPTNSQMTATTMGGTPTNAKRSSFLRSINKRTAGLPPAEYDTLDFETRAVHLGGGSDEDVVGSDDLNGNGKVESIGAERRNRRKGRQLLGYGAGHERKESKDDAWVDILVGSQRRMEGHSAESSGGKRRSMDDLDGEMERVQEEVRRVMKEVGDGEDVEPPRSLSRSRFKARANGVGASSARSSEDASADDEDVYGAPYSASKLAVPQPFPDAASIDSGDFEPIPHMRAASDQGSSTPQRPLSPPPDTPPKPTVGLGKLGIGGKGVSSLIDVYREKEKASSSPSPAPSSSTSRIQAVAGSLGASKLPVRTASLAKPPAIVPSSDSLPPPEPPSTTPPPRSSIISDADSERLSINIEEMDDAALEAYLTKHVAIKPTTPRYVHGAPLHNVVEAEEEEVEE